MLKKRFFASCLAALLLLGTLCGCGRTVRLSSGETFTVVKIQSGSTEYGYGPRGIPATPVPTIEPEPSDEPSATPEPVVSPESTPAEAQTAPADMHFFLQQQTQEVQDLYWYVYHAVERFETKVEMPAGTTRDQLNLVNTLLYNDSPELFQYSHLSTYYFRNNAPELITSADVTYFMTRSEYENARQKVEALADQWLSEISGKSDYEKELYLHDAVVNGCTYQLDTPHAGTVYGTLILGEARCQGYANTMTYLLRRAGIPCMYLHGTAPTEDEADSHAWNAAQIDGTWVLLDTTWDDPTGGDPKLSHAYFNVNEELMGQTHHLDPDFSLGTVPACTSLAWCYSVQQGNFASADQDAVEFTTQRFAEALRQRQSLLELQFAEQAQCQTVIDHLSSIMEKASELSGVPIHSLSYSPELAINQLGLYLSYSD